jgi:hypothetical protein
MPHLVLIFLHSTSADGFDGAQSPLTDGPNRRPICFSPKRAAGVAATDDRPGAEGVWGEPGAAAFEQGMVGLARRGDPTVRILRGGGGSSRPPAGQLSHSLPREVMFLTAPS